MAQGSPANYSEDAGELGTVLISDLLTALTHNNGFTAMLYYLEPLDKLPSFHTLMVKSFMFQEVERCIWND